MEFDWNDLKEAEVRAERGHGFGIPVQIFLGRTVEWDDDRTDYGEDRVVAVGRVQGRYWTVVYVNRGPVRWIVTAWPSSKWERERWHE